MIHLGVAAMEGPQRQDGDADTTPLLRQRTDEDDTISAPDWYPLGHRVFSWVVAVSTLCVWSLFCSILVAVVALNVGPVRHGGRGCNDNIGLDVGAWYLLFGLGFAVMVGVPACIGLHRLFTMLYPRRTGEGEDYWAIRSANHRLFALVLALGFWLFAFSAWAEIMSLFCFRW